jgi:RNA-directed DNA polymerase
VTPRSSKRALLEKYSQQPAGAYRRTAVPKQNGKVRVLWEPCDELKSLQNWLLKTVLAGLEPSPWAHGYVNGRSIMTHARTHLDSRWVVTCDLHNFFGSVTTTTVATTLVDQLGLSDDHAQQLAEVCTWRGRLPQGAPTSPVLSNAALSHFDLEVADAVLPWRYSRYVDDLAFSAAASDPCLWLAPHEVVYIAKAELKRWGFDLAERKTRGMPKGQRQLVTGLIVNGSTVRAPRELRRKVRAGLHNRRFSKAHDDLDGLLKFIAMVEA